MAKKYFTSCLVTNERGEHLLQRNSGKVVPGTPFIPESSANTALAGGFPTLSPETSFFLSPTLQLNTDLANLAEDSAKILAEAELRRFQRFSVRNYQVDVDPRVCVISKDFEKIEAFMDSYGGVLDIEPVLLGRSHPDHPLVTEVECSSSSEQLRLRLRKRAPLNSEKCTYCGFCGPSCPEKCISAHLYFDYGKCTFCKECEKACPEGAIDIYGVEEIVMKVPAVILLGEVDIELPEDRHAIFRDDQLPEFFKTIYSAEIQEVVCHNNSICQYSGRLDTSCGRCVDSCPHQALARSKNGITIDHFACLECGICMAICPTGAMQNGNFNDETLLAYLKEIHPLVKGKNLVIGDEEKLHDLWWRHQGEHFENMFFLEYSSLSSLSFAHYLLFLAAGAQRVTLLVENQNSGKIERIRQVELANNLVTPWLGSRFIFEKSGEELKDAGDLQRSPSGQTSLELPAYRHRRAMVSQIMKQLIVSSGTSFSADQLGGEFVSLLCDSDNCTHCLACLNECKVEALQADQESLSLTYSAGNCVGCGICVSICPEKVLSINEDISLNEGYFTRQTLTQADGVHCKSCGKVFGTRKSLERVMAILSAREKVDTEHFEYCDTCRVVRLFETEGS